MDAVKAQSAQRHVLLNVRVRIHTVGFPVLFDFSSGLSANVVRYAALMRKLAETNNGSFVGLNSVR